MYPAGDYDFKLVFATVGGRKVKIPDGQRRGRDVVLGLASSGVHQLQPRAQMH
jgi:phosphoribosylaminoimidazole (AIR) synthetase